MWNIKIFSVELKNYPTRQRPSRLFLARLDKGLYSTLPNPINILSSNFSVKKEEDFYFGEME